MNDVVASAKPGPADAVQRYKRIFQQVLQARPSGTRQRIAKALGKNRSFVSQIANPAYPTPIPVRHVDVIMEICHFSQSERSAFLDAYAEAHPDRLSAPGTGPVMRRHTILLPDFGSPEKNRKADRLIDDFINGFAEILDASGIEERDDKKTEGAKQ